MGSKEISALITLLDDPNSEIFNTVMTNLLSKGPEVIPQLEQAWESSPDEKLQRRIETIIQKIQFTETSARLKLWAQNPSHDLIKGASIISGYQYPDYDATKTEVFIEKLRKDIWLELNDGLTAYEKIRIVNHFIFEVHRFRRNTSNFNSPGNLFINNLIETKKGNTVSLGILYAAIAQRLDLPVYGVNLPLNFILCWVDEYTEFDRDNPVVEPDDILFYINPFNKGTVFGRKEIEFFIKQQDLRNEKSYFIPCSNIESIREMIRDLIRNYDKLGYHDKISDLNILLNLLGK